MTPSLLYWKSSFRKMGMIQLMISFLERAKIFSLIKAYANCNI